MVNFRQVTISNANNTDRIELNDFDGYLMTAPTGFGIYRTSEYVTVSNQRVQTNNRPTFQKITFTISIMGQRSDWENKYERLRDFISQYLNSGFRLYYTANNTTRYIKCDINIVDKTEKDISNLPIRLEVQPLSLWLEDVQKSSIKQGEESSIFAFEELENITDDYNRQYYGASFELMQDVEDEYSRDYYAIGFGSGVTQIATLLNAGTEETPLTIRIYGEAINPFITLKKYGSGEVTQYVQFDNLTIPSGYYLEINSDPTDTHIELVNNTTLERFDRESSVNIETNVYMTLPKGRWNIEVTDDSESEECYAEIFYANQYYGG